MMKVPKIDLMVMLLLLVLNTPLKITKAMGKKKIAKRSKIKPFVKIVNYNHIIPICYIFELDKLKDAVSAKKIKNTTLRDESKKAIKSYLKSVIKLEKQMVL